MSPESATLAPPIVSIRTQGSETAQRACIVVVMVASFVLQSAADAFWGVHLGLVAAFVLAFVLAWVASQSSRYSLAYAVIPIAICCSLLCWCIISPLPGATIEGLPVTDRLNYYILYHTPAIYSYTDYEIGFLTLIAACRPFIDFQAFLILCVIVTLLGYLQMLSAFGRSAYFSLLLCFGLGYFAFWSGVLNVTRQFMAGGLIMIAASFLLTTDRHTTRTHLLCALIGIAAMSIHSSAAILFLFQALVLIKKRNRLLIAMWAFNILIFTVNIIGLSPLRPLTSRISGFRRYDIEQASAADLVNIMNTGVGTGNRPDWAIFLLIPMLLYGVFRVLSNKPSGDRDDLSGLALFYTTVTVPFYAMSYLIYADRLAYYAYLTFPPFILIISATQVMKPYRAILIATMAGLAISQFGLGWYGYTPLFWSGALLRVG
ncbi:EpsG family protein [Sphingomonas melonis]|uniref:EpsG family protein n=1 Tax=Sphingomonas melonis TaxID=152682 RepID=UPI000374F3B3|nr:EpsG family protein [Sphingomonas melonis]